VKIEAIRDAQKMMRMTKTTNEFWCAESSFFSIAFAFSMMKSSTEILLFVVDVIARRFDFFALIVAYMTKTVNFSTYLFNQSFDQFVEIARKFSIVCIKWTFLIIFFIISLSRKSL
jgi:hypothetical protein